MPQFDPELIQVMRSVLDDVMSSVPLEISGATAKAYLAEAILKAAAQGHTSYNELMAAATDQIDPSEPFAVQEAAQSGRPDPLSQCPFL
jgi:hypothetical protein